MKMDKSYSKGKSFKGKGETFKPCPTCKSNTKCKAAGTCASKPGSKPKKAKA